MSRSSPDSSSVRDDARRVTPPPSSIDESSSSKSTWNKINTFLYSGHPNYGHSDDRTIWLVDNILLLYVAVPTRFCEVYLCHQFLQYFILYQL